MFDYNFEACPVCNHTTIKAGGRNRNLSFSIECPRCGKFDIDEVCLELRDVECKIKSNSAKISGYIRLQNEIKNPQSIIITSQKADEIIADPTLPKDDDIEKKAEFLLDSIKRKTKIFGKPVSLISEADYALAFAKNEEELDALLEFLQESGYLKFSKAVSEAFDYPNIKLTAKGWKYFQDNNERSKSKNVFIAAYFDESMNESITAICDIVRKHNLAPICIKDEDFKERIMDKALGEIKNSKFLIVDLTNHRPAVLFEAGFAHALGIDMIFVHKKGDKDHVTTGFYTSHFKIHEYNDIEELKKKLDDVIPVRIT